jgi:hypothetical protein
MAEAGWAGWASRARIQLERRFSAVHPIIDVVSRRANATKIGVTVMASNLTGVLICSRHQTATRTSIAPLGGGTIGLKAFGSRPAAPPAFFYR